MRVTGGKLGGRAIRVPSASVRPTQDRVREALFSALQDVIPDIRFLDLFAGSGAVGIEAWSRGAASVCWVEEERRVHQVLKCNVTTLGGEGLDASVMRCVCADVFSFLRKGLAEPQFDIIFADPPYHKGQRAAGAQFGSRLLEAVTASGMLTPKGLLILEQGSDEWVPMVDGWELVRDRRYSGSRIRFFRAKGDAS